MPPDIEINVKKLYKGACVITGFNSCWRTQISYSGNETSHIIPKAMLFLVRLLQLSLIIKELRNPENGMRNCMAMESFSHTIHYNCLLVVHALSMKAPYFGSLVTLNKSPIGSGFSPLFSHDSIELLYMHISTSTRRQRFL